MRQAVAAGLIGMFFTGSFYLAQPLRVAKYQALVEGQLESEPEEEGENDADQMFTDRPDLALAQEMDLTRDPATGLVPRERLLAAARYNETMLAARAGQRPTAGVLSNATWTERGPSNVSGRVLGLLVDPNDPVEVLQGIRQALATPKGIPVGLDYFAFPRFQERCHALVDSLMSGAKAP